MRRKKSGKAKRDPKITNELTLTLVENAEDFLIEAVRHAKASSARDWKYALLHLFSALELLLKAILEKEHWTLLFGDVDNASRLKLRSGDFQSVSFDKALERIDSILGITILPKDVKYLKGLRELRNQSTHFRVKLNVDQAKSLVARGINIFLTLQQQYLQETPDKKLEYEINQALQEFEKYVDERLRTISDELSASERPHEWFRGCPRCAQETLISRNEEVLCLFCGESYSFEDLAIEKSEGPGGPCPECEEGILALVLLNNEEGQFVCIRCGFETEQNLNTECSSCGGPFWNDHESLMCDDCWSNRMEKD